MTITSGTVTIGIPTFNYATLAVRAIQSALAQTYPNVEVLVSDDASKDDTLARVKEIEEPRLVVYSQPKRLGLAGNFDFCLRHASGEFFLLLGQDDFLLPAAVKRLVEPFLRPASKRLGLSWCPCHIGDARGNRLWSTQPGPAEESTASLLRGVMRGCRGPRLTSVLVRTADALAVGGYQERHGDLCDIGNWGQAALLHDRVACLPQPLVQYTNHHGSTTSQSKVREWQQWARVVHADWIAAARARGDEGAARTLQAVKKDLLSSVTLSILIQKTGQPGWILSAFREVQRSPDIFFSRYMGRRLLKDGWKALKLPLRAGAVRQPLHRLNNQ